MSVAMEAARPNVPEELSDLREEIRQLNEMIRSLHRRLSMHDDRIAAVERELGEGPSDG